jgi:hypothetical protein
MIAPRLTRALRQMDELERVLGFLRDEQWTGGASVLVRVNQYVPDKTWAWVYVDSVKQGDASPYPIRGVIDGRPGQWAFWEVAGVHHLADDFPELIEMQPTFPHPLPNPASLWGHNNTKETAAC